MSDHCASRRMRNLRARRSARRLEAVRQRRGAGAGVLRPAGRTGRALCQHTRTRDAGPAAEVCDGAGARRLWTGRDRDFGRRPADQDRRQSAASRTLGSTDVFAEAAVLSLYDPDRSKAPYSAGRIQSWSAFEAALSRSSTKPRPARRGPGAADRPRHLADADRADRRADKAFAAATWHRYEPVEDDAVRAGAMQAFGRRRPRFRASPTRGSLFCLDADPLGFGPEQIRFGRDISTARQSRASAVVAPLCGGAGMDAERGARRPSPADRPELVRNIALVIARSLGAACRTGALPAEAEQFAKAAAADLVSRKGAALVLAGPRQPAEVHALCHWINGQLRAPVDFIAPVDPARQATPSRCGPGRGCPRRPRRDAVRDRRQPSLRRAGRSWVCRRPRQGAVLGSLGLSRRDRGAQHLAPAAVACARKLVGHSRVRRHREHRAAADPAAL